MRCVVAVSAMLGCVLVVGTAGPTELDSPGVPTPQAARTGKERLGDKASDEQRVDDCKVPPDRRTRTRQTACPDAGG